MSSTKVVSVAKHSKYRVDLSKRKHLLAPMFDVRKVIHSVVTINDAEVDKFRKRHGRLPIHVYLTEDSGDEIER